ncbi:variant erythrocyte surface antigen-1, alpha subunit [Babesia caballi]|uniref:Variant erythrocyte surface antigen-1, alpha subunit n=1 Tax=Babesia caballi TaxID=5871 RepID=A0AAV4LXT6_BABCB|nr:variant erythrocyte surface antigen-1, alpha subunit [Babesia caballi]
MGHTIASESNFQDVCGKVAVGVGAFLGYNGTFLTTAGIIKNESGIVQAYTDIYKNATWPQDDQQTCVFIFLATAVVVYYCLTYIYWRCSTSNTSGGWEGQTVGGGGVYLNEFLNAMGYNDNMLNNAGDGRTIMNKVALKLEELTKASSDSYSEYIQTLERLAAGQPINRPLASCFKLADKYFTKQGATNVTNAILDIRGKLESLSLTKESYHLGSLNVNPYDALKPLIADLLSHAAKFKPNEASTATAEGHGGQPTNQSSIGGSIAGALTSIAAAGGAGAAYAFNVGGFQAILGAIFNFK